MRFSECDAPAIHTAVFEKIRLAAQVELGDMPFLRESLDLKIWRDPIARRLVLCLRGAVLGKLGEQADGERKWPADWWQALKERWFPKWMLKRWPVKYERVALRQTVYRLCPHPPIKVPQEQSHVHFQWLESP